MLISIKKRFIFIASSKTASTSIEAALLPYAEIHHGGSPQRKHISWKQARKEYNFLFNIEAYNPKSFFKFGVVREPIEWVVSWYNYRCRHNRAPNSLPENMTFDQFWESNDWIKKRSQKNHFSNNNNVCVFNLIIPHEKVNQAFPIVAKHLKLEKKIILPRKNEPPIKKIIRSELNANIVSQINAYYQQDFDFWTEWMGKIDSSLERLK